MIRVVGGRRWFSAAAVWFVLAACGGGDASEERAERTATPATTAPDESPALRGATVTVDEAFWFAGFKVTVGTATLGEGRGRAGGTPEPVVSMATTFENLGDDRARFDDELVLQSRGRSHFRPGPGNEVPEVPSGASARGTVEIVVDPTFRFDDAVLVAGGAGVNQASVPLGRSGRLVTHEPRPVPLAGRLETTALTIQLRGGELRSDQPDRHRQVEAGRRALVLNFTQSVTGCQVATLLYDLDLQRPDGTTANSEYAGDPGKPDNFVVFLVPDPPAGTYTLRLDGRVGGSSGPTCPARYSAETTFTL